MRFRQIVKSKVFSKTSVEILNIYPCNNIDEIIIIIMLMKMNNYNAKYFYLNNLKFCKSHRQNI